MQWLSAQTSFFFPYAFFRCFQVAIYMWFLAFIYAYSSHVSYKHINGHIWKSIRSFLIFNVHCTMLDSYSEFLQGHYGSHLESCSIICFQSNIFYHIQWIHYTSVILKSIYYERESKIFLIGSSHSQYYAWLYILLGFPEVKGTCLSLTTHSLSLFNSHFLHKKFCT